MGGIGMKTIEEWAKEWGEHIFETTPHDVVNGKACAFVEDRDITDVAEESYIAVATTQKAIDEQVRLKKCDDMTQEGCDREAAFVEWYRENGKGIPTYSDAIEWARKEVIDKACVYLKENVEGGVHPQSAYGFVDKFRKEIEKSI